MQISTPSTDAKQFQTHFNIDGDRYYYSILKCLKKVNMSIFPVGYPEAVYKEIVHNSVQDPLQLTKIALYQIQDAALSSRNEISTTCVGIMCCWLVDTTEGTYNHFIVIKITMGVIIN